MSAVIHCRSHLLKISWDLLPYLSNKVEFGLPFSFLKSSRTSGSSISNASSASIVTRLSTSFSAADREEDESPVRNLYIFLRTAFDWGFPPFRWEYRSMKSHCISLVEYSFCFWLSSVTSFAFLAASPPPSLVFHTNVRVPRLLPCIKRYIIAGNSNFSPAIQFLRWCRSSGANSFKKKSDNACNQFVFKWFLNLWITGIASINYRNTSEFNTLSH